MIPVSLAELHLITTEDGSHSIQVPGLEETYHSRFGAITESRHVYIANGLHHLFEGSRNMARVLEVGFGTGLNALLTCWESYHHSWDIEYWAIEPYPIPSEIVTLLNFNQFFPEPQNWLPEMHSGPWNTWISISGGFKIIKVDKPVQDFEHPDTYFDLIYFDAFGPSKQPEIWQCPLITRVADLLSPGGLLVTYSVHGKFRRCLQKAGCQVFMVDGPPGKLKMLRAVKN